MLDSCWFRASGVPLKECRGSFIGFYKGSIELRVSGLGVRVFHRWGFRAAAFVA